MRIYVGITDKDWYERLSASGPDEVNFWNPGEQGSFAALKQGELFLFKLHAPYNYIVGGGYFVSFSRLPMSLAWLAFGPKNGVGSLQEFHARIKGYRKSDPGPDPSIGNIILTQPFWFPREQWIPAPSSLHPNTVQGKGYDADDSRGYELYAAVRERLGQPLQQFGLPVVREEVVKYGEYSTRMRLGQGAFRVLVTDAYERRCAITGEKTLPVLEAAHIKPVIQEGPHDVRNGLLLRSDMHILFDAGLITVTPEMRIEISSTIQEQYTNGKVYYSYHGESLRSLPPEQRLQPSPAFLSWHNESVFIP